MPLATGAATGAGGAGTGSPASRRRGLLFLASVVIVVQVVAWRGTDRIKAVSYSSAVDGPFLHKRTLPPLDKGKARQFDGVQATRAGTSTSSFAPSSTSASTSSAPTTTYTPPCKPLPTLASPLEQCEHVRDACPPSGHIDYLQLYYCIGVDDGPDRIRGSQATPVPPTRASPRGEQQHETDDSLTTRQEALRGFVLACIIAWMLLLFSWVGLVASDFFCPNLGTIAARLGLSESTAGVTFLAFGNGSPDVFSTFGAMRTGSGSLAIGELIGAASFIVSVISGSMMLIAPFRVKPYPFLRDVGFFTVAVAVTMTFLFDGKLLFSECLCLIGLYILYAATVILGSWWQTRRHAQVDGQDEHGGHLERSPASLGDANMQRQGSSRSMRGTTSPGRPPLSAVEYDPDIDPFAAWDSSQVADQTLRDRSPSYSPNILAQDLPSSGSGDFNNRLSRFRAGIVARHSLLGAVEFRDVVRNLQSESSADVSEAVFQSRDPERFLPHEHHHRLRAPSSAMPALERHRRNKSLAPTIAKPASPIAPFTLHRSQSVIGAASNEPSNTRDLASVADAVDDPWREHGPGDACEGPTLLPSPALPFSDSEADAQPHNARGKKPTLPRLALRRPTGSSAPPQSSPSMAETTTRGAPNSQRRLIQTTIKALFPSLRHLHQKSWLGIFIGIVTAPAILLLNLTLPVVDDAAEQDYLAGEKEFPGPIRLDGEEGELNARTPDTFDEDEDDEDDDTGRGIINLGSNDAARPVMGSSSMDSNPWESSSAGSNRRSHLAVSTALHKLPGDISPLTQNASPKKQYPFDTQSIESDSSVDSHATSSQASNGFLVIAQCTLAPPFCVWAISSSADSDNVEAKTIGAFFIGLNFAAMVTAVHAFYRRNDRFDATEYMRAVAVFGWVRVAIGFLVSILYIMTIVDEVVSILQTLGMILGLSDAILGLTVFAMGNSLGDLVANITIARMGHPVMAVSACFAGPLLNLLLGIGISGSWLLSGTRATSSSALSWAQSATWETLGHKAHPAIYHIDVSPTLSVSGVGLLVILGGILIGVPLNNFHLDRRIGMALIATYCVIMCTNIAVEVYYMRQGGVTL